MKRGYPYRSVWLEVGSGLAIGAALSLSGISAERGSPWVALFFGLGAVLLTVLVVVSR